MRIRKRAQVRMPLEGFLMKYYPSMMSQVVPYHRPLIHICNALGMSRQSTVFSVLKDFYSGPLQDLFKDNPLLRKK